MYNWTDKDRSYKNWVRYFSMIKGLNIVLRHDIDFDIRMARKMLEAEYNVGISSVIYFDIHSPSYNKDDIISLYNDFSKLGFLFGLHINVAYDYDNKEDILNAYKNDLKTIKNMGIDIHSCTEHFYSESIANKGNFTNKDVCKLSTKVDGCPDSFSKVFGTKDGIYPKLSDSGGKMLHNPIDWIKNNINRQNLYMVFHPIHYYDLDNDIIYSKRDHVDKTWHHPPHNNIHCIQRSISEELTPYLSASIERTPSQRIALDFITKIATERYRQLINVVDVACGIGLLGAYLQKFNNIRYTGIDYESKFIESGKELFRLLGYAPKLICGNMYGDIPDADIIIALAFDDCPTDWVKLYDLYKKYNEVIISIPGEQMLINAKKKGKKYYPIDRSTFEKMWSNTHDIVESIDLKNSRVFYWFKKRS